LIGWPEKRRQKEGNGCYCMECVLLRLKTGIKERTWTPLRGFCGFDKDIAASGLVAN
jgi:hypothetical protein